MSDYIKKSGRLKPERTRHNLLTVGWWEERREGKKRPDDKTRDR